MTHTPTAPLDPKADDNRDERRSRMLSLIREREFVRVQDLSDAFRVSTVTIRTDLEALARRGAVRRVRGGAMRSSEPGPELRYEARGSIHMEEKRAIGRFAAGLLSSGDTVILDVGTTTMEVAHAIVERESLTDLTVFTPGLNVALALESAIPRVQVVVTGGTLRPHQHSLVEPMSTLILDRIRVRRAFIGCNGFDPRGGIMGVSLADAALKQSIVRAAHRTTVLADASKFTQTGLVTVCSYADVDRIITAGRPDPAALAAIQDGGASVEVLALRA